MVDSTIALIYNNKLEGYKIAVPFNPPKKYPELSRFNFEINPDNDIYAMVRDVFIKLQMDKKKIGTSDWNPFSKIIKLNDQVLIKPNFVKEFHQLGIEGVISQITHGAVLRPIIDYILITLKGTGKIIIADTPLEKANFKKLIEINKVSDLCKFYKDFLNVDVQLYDLRSYKRKVTRSGRFLLEKVKLSGPPKGFFKIDLKNQSEFNELDNKSPYYCTLADYKYDRYNPRNIKLCETNKYHSLNKHIFKIPKLILESNVIISVPKLKTHKMAGVTLNLKNMIGICEKIFLPHFRQGVPPIGDAIPKQPPTKDIVIRKFRNKFDNLTISFIKEIEKIPILNHILKPYYRIFLKKTNINIDWWGMWYGNDTLWRTIFDLNKIILYSNIEGNLQDTKQRKYFNIIDGIIGQEGEGPMTGNPKNCGIIIGGFDPVASDTVASYIMGYDINKLKIINKNKDVKKYRLGNCDMNKIKIVSNTKNPLQINLNFKLPMGYGMLARKN